MYRKQLLLLISLLVLGVCSAKDKNGQNIYGIGFYNLENLFDTCHDEGKNDYEFLACDPMLTTVEQRGHRVGEEAATILMDKVEGLSPLEKIEKRVVRTRLVVRGTTK